MQTYRLEPLLRGQPWHFKWGSLLLGIEIKYVHSVIVKYPFQFYIMFAHEMLTSQFFFSADIGGQMGLCLGASLLSIYECIEAVMLALVSLFKGKVTNPQPTSITQ